MNTKEKCSQFVKKIKEIINSGFELTDSDCHFISSSFSISTAEELKKVFTDEDSDADVITELVIAPDDKIQEKLELDLCEVGFSKEDEAEIVKELCSIGPDSEIIFPDNTGTVSVKPDGYLLHRFIHKLRIANNPDKYLFKVSESLPERFRLKMLVRLRNAGVEYDSGMISFLVRFLKEKTLFDQNFYKLFDFTVSLLEENSDKQDLLDFFITKKRSYEKTLGTIKEVNKQLKTSAVETMMMQGTRIPPASEEEIKSKVEMAETILATLFGYLDFPKEKPADINLGTVSGKDGLEKTIKLLS